MDSFYMPTLATTSLTAILITIVALYSRASHHQEQTLGVPTLGIDKQNAATLKRRFVTEADTLLREGYEAFKDGIFQVLTPDGPRLFLPRRFAEDLRKYTREEASGMQALSDRLLGHYTTIGHESPVMMGAIKIDLNKHLGNFVGAVAAEVADYFESTFPPCEDWTPVNVHETLMALVARASQRIFVGYPMCRNEEWLACSIKFAGDVMMGGQKLKVWHPLLRPVAQYWIPEMTQITGDHQQGLSLLKPEFERRSEERKHGLEEERYDMIEWMRERAKKLGYKSFSDKELAKNLMLTTTAAIHTTRLALVHALYDLAARQEYIEPLRDEILEATKYSGGVVQKQDLTHMKKLDSFMKESSRHNPASLATLERKALIPITLSNGYRIPAGTIAQCSTQILDEFPREYGDPHDFDGFRFYKLRQNPDDANRFQFSSVTYDSMQFGYGNDACPGRFYAGNQLKVILAYILTHYDIKFPDGVKGRPKNITFEVNILADPTQVVLFKKKA